jgi:hypothetical protein
MGYINLSLVSIRILTGDQAIWWVYNDKGNIHTESGGDAIGIEIQAMAFAFSTNDEINDMTFYKYNVINFATTPLDSVYFGYWVDPDLGAYDDDWVGCDTALSLGMVYNGDAVDGPTTPNYGANPPIFGTDFFQGPIKYIYDGGSIVDSVRLGMAAFLYYNNDFTVIGNPEVAAHFYGYLSGSWKDGSPFTFGGNGYGGTEPTPFMFPSDPSDPTGWSECTEANAPADRRYLQSSGPFRLEPGATNEVVIGAVWVRPPSSGGCLTNFDQIFLADQKAQALFDADFDLIDGPDAPDMTLRELDKEIIISLTNGPNSNNVGESYEETDPIISSIISENPDITDSTYNFQGYKVFQLASAQVSPSEFTDVTKARLIYQCDLKDGVTKLVNFKFDPILGADVPELKVDGEDKGIRHTFRVTDDAFATENTKLVNYQNYYFAVVSYAYNDFKAYDPTDPNTQKTPYLEGRNNIKVYSAVPHITDPENNGTILNSEYGDGPDITQIEGIGNGGYFLELTSSTVDTIITNTVDASPTYVGRSAPIDVMVYDPIKVPNAQFEVILYDSSQAAVGAASGYIVNRDSTWWIMTNLTTGETVKSDFPIDFINEQIIPEWGLAVTVKAVNPPGADPDIEGVEWEENNGVIGASIDYENSNQQWLSGVPDVDGVPFLDWIRSGIDTYDAVGKDDNANFETLLGGTISPLILTQYNQFPDRYYMPMKSILGMHPGVGLLSIQLNLLTGVDLVYTPDRTKWTKCLVINTGEGEETNIYGEDKLSIRQRPSKDINGVELPGEPLGYSWFPGYAIEVGTGRRLNIMFGEDPFVNEDGNTNDMLFNPSSKFFNEIGTSAIFGGKHYVYVHRSTYDFCEEIGGILAWDGDEPPSASAYRDVFEDVLWIHRPLLAPGAELLSLEEGIIPTETKVSVRVTQSFANNVQTSENQGFPKYSFSTAGLEATVGDTETATSALDLVNVVPNPYYAYSGYENSAVDNRVKITNLPSNCTVSIYMMDGTLIRRFDRAVLDDNTSGGVLSTKNDNLDTSLEWDLKNSKNIPIASGIYLIHIDAGELGERTIKWFGITRPIDLDTF